MFGTRHNLLLLLLALSALLLAAQAEEQVKEDVIEIENKPQKVIRVSPLELPVKQDRTGSQMNSELFQIQTLRPGAQRPLKRLYMDSRRMRAGKKSPSATEAETQAAQAAQPAAAAAQ
ncbi:uncharacterized protein LOC108595625 isoform X2 [Drosophila busckii]|uniref:uncharacterized protein LOC108595625 isoform X2 n=1 Tax=Drosophila busckii TaxID=30019 RepID=UPI00083EC2BF|nr:uncharacterized protein LOC108595625 isoform X2 [Drosophila busckii]